MKITEEQFEILEYILKEAKKNITYSYKLNDAICDSVLFIIRDYKKENGYYALDWKIQTK